MDIRGYLVQKIAEYRQAQQQYLDNAKANDGAAQALETMLLDLNESEKKEASNAKPEDGLSQ